ncbi:MAG: decarboxylating 6-phosphogluconate dehydrogenase [Chloroflexota bacterium]|nr:decarboxylating 6-phosphogluconate dehydrogenase [Chloroflexota bacterium]
MQIGLVGLGRMGSGMSRRWLAAGHSVVGYARHAETVDGLLADKAISAGATSLKDFVGQLVTPRVVWLMMPAASVDATLVELMPLLGHDDVVVDGGNSSYVDDIRRAQTLADRGLQYVDCGTSGGVAGLERGYCLMIGGPVEAVQRLDPIFRALAPGVDAAPRTPGRTGDPTTAENGYLHCGPSGAGHFVKMVHNGIEYGLMAAYAEGLNILKHADAGLQQREVSAEITPLRDPQLYQYQLDIPAVTEVWRRGSVVASWLLDLAAAAFQSNGDLSDFEGRVSDSGEGRWTSIAAIDVGAPAPVLTTALYERFTSRGEADFADRVLSAMRLGFGGHEEAKG